MSRAQIIGICVVCPLCGLLAIRWFIELRHVDSPFGDNFGGTFMGGLLSLAGLAIAGFGLWLFNGARKTPVIACACPVCGIDRIRGFIEQPTPSKAMANLSEKARRRAIEKMEKDGWPTECGACIAYLRIRRETLEVREQSIDASDTSLTHYRVTPDQYVSITKRGDDAERTFQFQFPAMCAVCGAPDAPLRRKVGDPNRSLGTTDIIDDYLLWEHPSFPGPKTGGEQLDDALRGLETPVCANHTQTDYRGDALAYERGTLRFASYRYYKAFCALNGITNAPPVAAD